MDISLFWVPEFGSLCQYTSVKITVCGGVKVVPGKTVPPEEPILT